MYISMLFKERHDVFTFYNVVTITIGVYLLAEIDEGAQGSSPAKSRENTVVLVSNNVLFMFNFSHMQA